MIPRFAREGGGKLKSDEDKESRTEQRIVFFL